MSQRRWGPEQLRQGLPAGLLLPCSLSIPGSVQGFPCSSWNNSHQDHTLVLLETKCLWARTEPEWNAEVGTSGWGLTPWERGTSTQHMDLAQQHNGDNMPRSRPGWATWGWRRLPQSQGNSSNRTRSHMNTLQQREQGFHSHTLTFFSKARFHHLQMIAVGEELRSYLQYIVSLANTSLNPENGLAGVGICTLWSPGKRTSTAYSAAPVGMHWLNP